MKKFPTRLSVGKHEYRIVLMEEMDESHAGLCFYGNEKVILVSARQSKEEIIATLVHELLHAVEAEYRVKLGHPKIRKLEYALAQILSQLC